MGTLESIKKGFSLVLSSFPVVLVLFIFGFIFNLINIKLTPEDQSLNTPPSLPMILTGLVFILITIFIQAGSLGYVRDRIKSGAASFANFTAAGSKYYLRVLALSLITAVIIGVFVLLAALVVALIGQSAQFLALGLAIVIAAVGIYVLILLFFAPYIAVNEEKKVGECLRQSVQVVRANILKVLAISAVLVVIGFVAGLGIGLLAGALSQVVKGTASQVLFAFLSSLVNAFLGFFVTSSFMTFYLGLSAAPSTEATHQ